MTEGIHLARQLEASRQHVIEIPTSYVPSVLGEQVQVSAGEK